MTITCLWAWVAIVLTLPAIALYWATETTEQRIRRWHAQGMTQRLIAERLGISRYRVRRALG
jgi:DNA invertase Pin-like site-specific DNA recombinase